MFLPLILETLFSSDIHDKLINLEPVYNNTVVFTGELFETADDNSWWHLTYERECTGTMGAAGVEYAIPVWRKMVPLETSSQNRMT